MKFKLILLNIIPMIFIMIMASMPIVDSNNNSINFEKTLEKLNRKNSETNIEDSDVFIDSTIIDNPENNDNILLTFKNSHSYQTGLNELRMLNNCFIAQEMPLIKTIMLKTEFSLWENIVSIEGIESMWADQLINYKPISSENQKEILNKALEQQSKISQIEKPFVNTSIEINAQRAKNEGYNGSGIVIAVVDSGCDITGLNDDIDDFDDNSSTSDFKFRGAVSMAPDDPLYYTDILGRGTYHTGIALGTGTMNSSFEGIAPGAFYLSVKVYDPFGIALFSSILSGLIWSVENGADIILFCSSLPGFYNDPISLAINSIVDLGIVVVVPSGDDGPSFMSLNSPGQALKAITVGAYNSETGQVASFSGRGPTLDFRPGINIVAPGVNIVGPRAKYIANISSDGLSNLGITIPDNFELPANQFPTDLTFGEEIDDNYTCYSGTSAAAAIVAGGLAILMQEFPLATVEFLRIAMSKGAISLCGDVNVEGAGLLDIEAARVYLKKYFDPAKKEMNPLVSANIYPGFVTSTDSLNMTNSDPNLPENWNAYDSAMLVSTHSLISTIVVMNSSEIQNTNETSFTSMHLPLGFFGVSYDDKPFTLLAQFQVARELHVVVDLVSELLGVSDEPSSEISDTQGYNRYSGMLTDGDGLYLPIIIEVYEYTDSLTQRLNVFSLSIGFINTNDRPIENISLGSVFKADLFLNETNDSTSYYLDDDFQYNNTRDMIIITDTNNNTAYNYTDNTIAMGFNSTTHHTEEWEIGEISDLFNKLTKEEQLTNNDTSVNDESDTGFAMRWDIIDSLGPKESTLFASKLGIGVNKDKQSAIQSLFEQMDLQITNTTDPNLVDLVIVDANVSRVGEIYQEYFSSATVFNLGSSNEPLEIEMLFFSNRTNQEGKIEFLTVITITNLNQFEYLSTNATWLPIYEDVYSIGWAAVSLSLVSIFNYQIINPIISSYLIRTLIVIDPEFYESISLDNLLLSPNILDQAPMEINFPGDIGLWNITILTLRPIKNITFTVSGIGSNYLQNFTMKETLFPYDIISVMLIASLLAAPRSYEIDINIYQDRGYYNSYVTKLPIVFSLKPAVGRVFFDAMHNNLSLSMNSMDLSLNSSLFSSDSNATSFDFSNIGDLFGWDERLDTTYGNFYDFQKLWNENTPIGTPVQTLLSLGSLGNSTSTNDISSMFNLGDFDFDFDIGSDSNSNFTINPELLPDSIRGFEIYGNIENMTELSLDMNILQLTDVLVMNDPEIAYTKNDIGNVTLFVEKGGIVILMAETFDENNITSINELLYNFSLKISSELSGTVEINTGLENENQSSLLFGLNSLQMEDPVILESLNPNNPNVTLLLNNHTAISQYGRGKIIVLGDEDIFTNNGLLKANNSMFLENIIKWSLIEDVELKPEISTQSIRRNESVYFNIKIEDYESHKEFLQEGFILIASFVDPEGNSINYPMLNLPLFITWETEPGIYAVQFQAKLAEEFNVTGWYYAVFYFNHMKFNSEMFYVRFFVDLITPVVQYSPFEPNVVEDYKIFDFAILVFGLYLTFLIWIYRNIKRRERFIFTELTKEKKYAMQNFINEMNGLQKEIDSVLSHKGYNEIDKIRFLLKTRKESEELNKRIEKFSKKELGEF